MSRALKQPSCLLSLTQNPVPPPICLGWLSPTRPVPLNLSFSVLHNLPVNCRLWIHCCTCEQLGNFYHECSFLSSRGVLAPLPGSLLSLWDLLTMFGVFGIQLHHSSLCLYIHSVSSLHECLSP